jgi:hypothetical protein
MCFLGQRALRAGLIVFAVASISDVRAVTIGVDDRNGSSADFRLASGISYSDFRQTILGLGANIRPLTSFDQASIAGLDAIIVRQGSSIPYSTNEISAMHSFTDAGHGAIFCAEGGGQTDATVTDFNQLTGYYGVTVSASATDGSGRTITGFVPHPLVHGVNSIGIDFQRPFVVIQPPAMDLTIGAGNDDILAVAGHVVLLSDTSLWAGSTGNDRPITFGDNQQLLRNAVQFTTGVPEVSTASSMMVAMFCACSFLTAKRRPYAVGW